MTLNNHDIENIANLAKLNIPTEQMATIKQKLQNVFELVEQLNQANLGGVEPITHSIDDIQPLRSDYVSEPDQRKELLAIAPQVMAGLYIVPKVLE